MQIWGIASYDVEGRGYPDILLTSMGDNKLQTLTVGGGHAGGQLSWLHFGVGTASGARVRIQWPDGALGPWLQVRTNQFPIVERDSAWARASQPG